MATAVEKRKEITLKNVDMSKEMEEAAISCASLAIDKYEIEKDIAEYVREEFDRKYQPTWHCIVGRNFGSYVSHDTKHFIFFYIG